jgi:hypothetical protein
MKPEQAAALRAPFPKATIGKLPKGGTQLDYVGHAAVTDRLLTIDPDWTWEPMACDEHGNPLPDLAGNLWIRLTICGVTRIGVGDGASMKVRIGDAIRNAAMRFGVALDLWSKEELEQSHGPVGASRRGAEPVGEAAPPPPPVAPAEDGEEEPLPVAAYGAPPPRAISKPQNRMLYASYGALGIADQDEIRTLTGRILARELESMSHLTAADASRLIDMISEATSREDLYARLERAGR